MLPASIYDLASYYDHSQKKIFVNWSMLPTSTPQLSYEVKIYENSSYSGNPIASIKGTDPDITSIGFLVKGMNLKAQDYYIALQITDIFGQLSPVKKTVLEEKKP